MYFRKTLNVRIILQIDCFGFENNRSAVKKVHRLSLVLDCPRCTLETVPDVLSTTCDYDLFTKSNQRLGSVFYRICGMIMENWVV